MKLRHFQTPDWWRTESQIISPRAKIYGLDKIAKLVREERKRKRTEQEKS